MKLCGDSITPAISYIINQSIKTGVFPDKLKESYVIPISKAGDKQDPHNYRPISILSSISKIFERHIASQLHQFFDKTNIIHNTQSGFRRKHSCTTALVRLIDSWLEDIDSGKYVGAVFLDLRKAFDLVDHEILIHKLSIYNFSNSSMSLFSSYLLNRHQIIKSGAIVSDSLVLKSGVPQGSILGPLLFLLYINDITFETSPENIDLFADDGTLHEADRDIKVVEHKLQKSLTGINNWCKLNNMALHPLKTKCMVITSKNKHRLNSNLQLNILIADYPIQNVKSHKLLGIYIDNILSWNVQMTKLCSNVRSKIALLKRISGYLSDEMKAMFYHAYILSIINYGSIVWCTTDKNMNILNKLQIRVARTITNTTTRTNHSILLRELNWLSISNICKYNVALLVYKSINNLAPEYISDLVNLSNNSTYNL